MDDKFRIATFNANSLRARLGIIIDWLKQHQPDALCIQEIKVMDDDFPMDAFTEVGYNCVFKGQKSYNGVAIVSREQPEDVVIGLGKEPQDQEARIIRARIKGVNVVNTYVPQGTAVDSPRFTYKLDWIMGMKDYFNRDFTPDDPVVWVGDFNVARDPMDVYDPEGMLGGVCYHPDEHKAFDYVRDWGFIDIFRKYHPDESYQFSFYDYRIPNAFKRKMGWRLDNIWATRPLSEKAIDCWIDLKPRQLEKPSDHTFVVADFNLGQL